MYCSSYNKQKNHQAQHDLSMFIEPKVFSSNLQRSGEYTSIFYRYFTMLTFNTVLKFILILTFNPFWQMVPFYTPEPHIPWKFHHFFFFFKLTILISCSRFFNFSKPEPAVFDLTFSRKKYTLLRARQDTIWTQVLLYLYWLHLKLWPGSKQCCAVSFFFKS